MVCAFASTSAKNCGAQALRCSARIVRVRRPGSGPAHVATGLHRTRPIQESCQEPVQADVIIGLLIELRCLQPMAPVELAPEASPARAAVPAAIRRLGAGPAGGTARRKVAGSRRSPGRRSPQRRGLGSAEVPSAVRGPSGNGQTSSSSGDRVSSRTGWSGASANSRPSTSTPPADAAGFPS